MIPADDVDRSRQRGYNAQSFQPIDKNMSKRAGRKEKQKGTCGLSASNATI